MKEIKKKKKTLQEPMNFIKNKQNFNKNLSNIKVIPHIINNG